ncbi:hypothetical protein ABT301_29545 [Streptomyces sp. NPDC000987]|uniref:hypothetical protein n=1 Tax=Streptomyces sp. NPDC000987 TaxID=3154374 RepID=UPI00332BEE3B
MTGTDGSYNPPALTAWAAMPVGEISLLPSPNTWVNLPGTDLLLPAGGSYDVDVTWRAHVQGTPPGHYYISGRLWDVTAGAVVPSSETWVTQFNVLGAGVETGADGTGDAHVRYQVTAPTTLRMQAYYAPLTGAATIARVLSQPTGWTRARATQVGV